MIGSALAAPGSTYRLYGSPQSGHSYKVRMALLLWDVPHDYRSIDLSVPAAERDPEWRRASRFGEVPLLISRGRALCQSNAILLHLARTHGILGWERDPELIGEWLFWESNRIGLSLPNYRFLRLFQASPEQEALNWLRRRLDADLQRLEDELKSQPYLAGDTLSAADLSCSAYLHYRDLPELDLAEFPAVSRWLDRIASQPGWIEPQIAMAVGEST